MTDIFEALAAPARRILLDELRDENGQTLFSLVARVTMKHHLTLSRQAISQHLAVLEEVGLVRTRKVGRCKHHDLDPTPLAAIANRWPHHTSTEPAQCTSRSPRSLSKTKRTHTISTPRRSASK